ncbi:MAG: hypothetical protein KBG73_02980 [Candidatus Promineofilum sp.]|nr:hypothetical protein [Promineifilum sp.]
MTVGFDLTYKQQLQAEIEATPGEYLPALLAIVRLYRQSVALKPAADSFRQGWQEALSGQTLPLSELWQDIDAK